MNGNIFYNNFKFLLKSTGIRQNYLLKELDISHATVWRWKKGAVPKTVTVQKIILFFESKGIKLSIDEILHQSLEDSARDLPVSEVSPRHAETDTATVQELSSHEIKFIQQIRDITGTRRVPITPEKIDEILTCIDIVYTSEDSFRTLHKLFLILRGHRETDGRGDRFDKTPP
jgi:transcriptional regulator with XRE-family HTH domain